MVYLFPVDLPIPPELLKSPSINMMETKIGDVNLKAEVIEGGMKISAKDTTGKSVTKDNMEAYVSNGDDGSFSVTVKPKSPPT
jgi:hypothetical protein